MSETRTMSKDGKKTSGKGEGAAEAAGGEKATKKKLLVVVAALLVLGAAAAWFFLMGPGAASAEADAPEPPPELGEVLVVEPISINLADGHYLKLGLGLQAVAEVAHAPDGSIALDAAISLYSGRSMAELSDPARRDALKEELRHTVEEEYHHDVVDVYFTEYVMQ